MFIVVSSCQDCWCMYFCGVVVEVGWQQQSQTGKNTDLLLFMLYRDLVLYFDVSCNSCAYTSSLAYESWFKDLFEENENKLTVATGMYLSPLTSSFFAFALDLSPWSGIYVCTYGQSRNKNYKCIHNAFFVLNIQFNST